MKLWPFKDKPAPLPAPERMPQKSPVPPGYEQEYVDVFSEIECSWTRSEATGVLIREIIALQARLDKHGIGK